MAIIVLGVLLAASIGFGVWIFMQYQDQKNNVDSIAEERIAVALEEQKEELEADFTKRNERVVNTYTGPQEYGAVSFKYPRDWSIYIDSSSGLTPLSLYGAPAQVVESADNHGIRLEVSNRDYETELARFERNINRGTLKSSVFKNSGQTGVKLEGELANNLTGTIVLLPQRDKTVKFWTESNGFTNVYEQALETLTFTP